MTLVPPSYYDADYYQRGTLTGRSCYDDYHWMPQASIRLAAAILELTGVGLQQPILDFGCARGYLVKALRWMLRDAYGCDHSAWAIANADEEVRPYLRVSTSDHPLGLTTMDFQLIIAKDVLEHCDHVMARRLLLAFRNRSSALVIIVPVGASGGSYAIPYMDEEPDHVLRESSDWWCAQVEAADFVVKERRTRVEGIKDQWAGYPDGHAIIVAR